MLAFLKKKNYLIIILFNFSDKKKIDFEIFLEVVLLN